MQQYPSLLLCLLCILQLLVSSCAPRQRPQPALPSPTSPGQFIAAFAALPMSLAPHGQNSWHTAQILPLLYNGLTTLDQHLQPLPSLASRWEVSSDGLLYTLHLRQGVRFHHGKELEAADVRYSFQQAAAGRTTGQGDHMPFAVIVAIDTLDRHTLRFVLKEPYAPFLTKLTVLHCPIVPQGTPSTSPATTPSTGPFQLVSFEPGHSITLKKFAAYWENGLPRLENVTLRGIRDPATRLRLLQSGEVDYMLLEPLSQSIPSVDASQDVVLVNSAPTGTFSLVFNTQRQPFANVNVRRAFAWAVDKAALAHQVLGQYGVPVNQPFNPEASPWYVNMADRTPDLHQTRELLSKAGYAEGIKVRLPVMTNAALFTKTAFALQAQLQQAGISLHVEVIPVESMRHTMRQGEWDLLLRGEQSPLDPDDVYFAAFHASRMGTSNASGYHTPTLDTLLRAGRQTLERGKRLETYRQVVSQIQQDVPELYLFMARWPVAWRQRVQGYDRELLRCCLVQTLTSIANQGFKTMWLAE